MYRVSTQDSFLGNIVRKKQENVETVWLTLSRRFVSIMIFIDFHKAFDSLERDFLINCLEAFDFGTNVFAWVGLFTKICKAVLQ